MTLRRLHLRRPCPPDRPPSLASLSPTAGHDCIMDASGSGRLAWRTADSRRPTSATATPVAPATTPPRTKVDPVPTAASVAPATSGPTVWPARDTPTNPATTAPRLAGGAA